jgi:hypothetical protein
MSEGRLHQLVFGDDEFEDLVKSLEDAAGSASGDQAEKLRTVLRSVTTQRWSFTPGPEQPTVALMRALEYADQRQVIEAVVDEGALVQERLWTGLRAAGWIADPISPSEIQASVGAALEHAGFNEGYAKRVVADIGQALHEECWEIVAREPWASVNDALSLAAAQAVGSYLDEETFSMLNNATHQGARNVIALNNRVNELASMALGDTDQYRDLVQEMEDALGKLSREEYNAITKYPELSSAAVHIIDGNWPELTRAMGLMTAASEWRPEPSVNGTPTRFSQALLRNLEGTPATTSTGCEVVAVDVEGGDVSTAVSTVSCVKRPRTWPESLTEGESKMSTVTPSRAGHTPLGTQMQDLFAVVAGAPDEKAKADAVLATAREKAAVQVAAAEATRDATNAGIDQGVADALQKLRDEFYQTPKGIAALTGLAESEVRRLLKAADADAKTGSVGDMVLTIEESHIIEPSRVPEEIRQALRYGTEATSYADAA